MLAMTQATFDGIVLGGVIGLLLGVIPIIAGVKRNQPALGFSGFFAAIVCGAMHGIFLAIPSAVIFYWLIRWAQKKKKQGSLIKG